MKKHIFILFAFVSFVFGWIAFWQTVDPMNLPQLTQFVTDFSNVLSADQISELSALAKDYETKTTNQLVTVLFPNRNGNELFDIGMNIFNDNQIGQKDVNNGLLLVISTEEKKIRIVVGYWLEGSVPDLLASDIIEQDIRPLVNNWDFYTAIKNFYTRSINAIDTGEGKNYQDSSIIDNWADKENDFPWFLWIALWFALASLLKPKSRKKWWKWKKIVVFSIVGLIVVLMIWLSIFVVIGVLAWLFFGFTGIWTGRWGVGWGSFGGWWFWGWGWFSWWGGGSGGWGAGD